MSSIKLLDELLDLTNFDATLRMICEVDCAVPYKNPFDIITDRKKIDVRPVEEK